MMRGVSRRETSLVLLIAGALVALPPIAAQQPFTSSTNLVVVPVVVVDNKGATVEGLSQDAFQIFEDGKPVPVATFLAPGATPVTGEDGRFIVLALDNLLTAAEIGFRVKTIAKLFVDRMGPDDVMSVISINAGKATTTSVKTDLIKAIDKFQPSFGDSTWTAAEKARHGLRMISSLTNQVVKSTHRRKVFVFIGDEGLFSPLEPSPIADREGSLSLEWMEAIRATTRNNVAVYVIDPKGLTGGFADYSESFAEETGGDAWSHTNNYRTAADRIWLEAGRYYLLGYTAPVTDRKIHKIEVKVSKPGVTIRARKARG